MTHPRFRHDRFASPIGSILLVTDDEGRLRVLDFDDHEDRMHRLMQRQYGECSLTPGRAPKTIRTALETYFDGDLRAIDSIEVATAGSPFQRQVWAALRDIPAGATESYGALAARLGMPKAMRAVGLANGSNPIGIVVPCHRVTGADGSLTGYGGGIERKRWLLRHEHAAFRDVRAPTKAPRLPGL
jgi:O-6-methylguanine DNA methyltransferase